MNKHLIIGVIDDDEDDFLILKDLFSDIYRSNYTIHHFKDGKDLYAFLASNELCICFVDYKLSISTGTEIISTLSKSHPTLPCILLTGLADPAIDLEASNSGAYEYLPKSDLNPTLLERTIRYTLRNVSQLEQISEERQRFERVIEDSPYPMMLYGAMGAFRMISRSIRGLTGYSNEEFNTLDEWIDLVFAGNEESSEHIRGELMNAAGGSSSVYSVRHASGTMMLWQFKTVEVGQTETGETLYVTVASDITELTNALQKAEGANRAKSEFLNVISHELRTPLNPILGLTDLIKEEIQDPELLDMIQIIQDSGHGLVRLIEDLLNYTSEDIESFELVSDQFNFKSLLYNTVESVAFDFDSKGLYLQLEIEPDWECFEKSNYWGDSGRIGQVLFNLLNNAVKFTLAGGVRIKVSRKVLSRQSEQVRLEIIDTGCGIRERDIEKVFDPLFQVDSSNTRKHSGTGLGLAICKRLVKLMGGEIQIKSELGIGTTFVIMLPLQPYSNLVENDSSDVEIAEGIVGKILVVEDAKHNLTYITRLLKRHNFEVQVARDGNEAIAVFDEDPAGVSLILMDLHMPVCDGMEASRIIRERCEFGRLVPIVAVTANVGPKVESNCRLIGIKDILFKPFKSDELDAILKKYLKEV